MNTSTQNNAALRNTMLDLALTVKALGFKTSMEKIHHINSLDGSTDENEFKFNIVSSGGETLLFSVTELANEVVGHEEDSSTVICGEHRYICKSQSSNITAIKAILSLPEVGKMFIDLGVDEDGIETLHGMQATNDVALFLYVNLIEVQCTREVTIEINKIVAAIDIVLKAA